MARRPQERRTIPGGNVSGDGNGGRAAARVQRFAWEFVDSGRRTEVRRCTLKRAPQLLVNQWFASGFLESGDAARKSVPIAFRTRIGMKMVWIGCGSRDCRT